MLNSKNTIFPPNSNAFIDVTKAPYFLDNTGKEDCTQKLIKVLDDVLSEHIRDMKATYDKLCGLPCGARISNENRVNEQGLVRAIFPNRINLSPVIYFPNGTYLISDTITYSSNELHNTLYYYTSGGMEMNRCIRFVGQSKEGVVIKLKDNCKGFEFGQKRPIISVMHGECSNIAMSNYIQNLTIDAGSGNPGAVGLNFFANNSGAVRNVLIKSSDKDYEGNIGILIDRDMHSATNFYDVTIEGFDYGIRIETFHTETHFENITLRNQRRYGIFIADIAVQFIGLKSYNNVPSVYIAGPLAHVVITDAELIAENPNTNYSAIHQEGGVIFLYNINTKGYPFAYDMCWREFTLPTGYIEEFCNKKTYSLFDEKAKTVGLKVPHVPEILPENDFSKWACVNDFGAVGDGVTDDTEALRKAFSSGKPIIWFQQGRYLVNETIDIPETVERVHFMFCDVCATENLSISGKSVFRIVGNTDKLLFMEDLFSWNQCRGILHMFTQNGSRNAYIRDMHTQGCAFYRAEEGGAELFFENCACTILDKESYGHVPAFSFYNQTVWCHSINPERSMVETENRGGQMWWSGFKTEQYGTMNLTLGGGVTEILGGVVVVGADCEYRPVVTNNNSTVSAIFSTGGYHDYTTFPIAVKENRGWEQRVFKDKDMPVRNSTFYFVPLYSGGVKDKE